MITTAKNNLIDMPNLLLIAGNGRNVGKTFLACKIIKELANKLKVIGLKVSPHFHDFEKSRIIAQSDDYIVIEETQINQKDSSPEQKRFFLLWPGKNIYKPLFVP